MLFIGERWFLITFLEAEEQAQEIDSSKIHYSQFTYSFPPKKIACGIHHSSLDQQNAGREAGSNLWLFSLKSITQSTNFIWVHCFHLLNFSASTFDSTHVHFWANMCAVEWIAEVYFAWCWISRKLVVAGWSYSCFSKGRGRSEFFTRTPPPLSSWGILKRFWKQMVTGSNHARSLCNLYSAYQNPIMFPGSYHER